MKPKYIYLLIAVIGTVVPYYSLIAFLLHNGLDMELFFSHMFDKEIAAFFSWDVIISTFAVVTLVITEGKRLRMKNTWIYILFNLTVGVSLALPAFLFSRESYLKSK